MKMPLTAIAHGEFTRIGHDFLIPISRRRRFYLRLLSVYRVRFSAYLAVRLSPHFDTAVKKRRQQDTWTGWCYRSTLITPMRQHFP
jgi:hypothetical protein